MTERERERREGRSVAAVTHDSLFIQTATIDRSSTDQHRHLYARIVCDPTERRDRTHTHTRSRRRQIVKFSRRRKRNPSLSFALPSSLHRRKSKLLCHASLLRYYATFSPDRADLSRLNATSPFQRRPYTRRLYMTIRSTF